MNHEQMRKIFIKSRRFELKNSKYYCDGFVNFLNKHNIPKEDGKNCEGKEYDNLLLILEAFKTKTSPEGSFDRYRNCFKKITPIKRDKFKELIKVIEVIEGAKINPKDISCEYYTDDEIEQILKTEYNNFFECNSEIIDEDIDGNIIFIKNEIKELFISSINIYDVCKMVLYFDVFIKFDSMVYFLINAIRCMGKKSMIRVKKLFIQEIDFEDYILALDKSMVFFEMYKKIKNNQVENEVQEYLKEIGGMNELCDIFFEKVSNSDDWYSFGEPEYFYKKMETFFSLFNINKKNDYIWHLIINFMRVPDKERVFNKIDKLHKNSDENRRIKIFHLIYQLELIYQMKCRDIMPKCRTGEN